jgi:hypothetical protein
MKMEFLAYELAGMMMGNANIEIVVVIDPAERPFSILGSAISAEFFQVSSKLKKVKSNFADLQRQRYCYLLR